MTNTPRTELAPKRFALSRLFRRTGEPSTPKPSPRTEPANRSVRAKRRYHVTVNRTPANRAEPNRRTEPATQKRNGEPATRRTAHTELSNGMRFLVALIIGVVGAALVAVVSLSAHDIVQWAQSQTGLGLGPKAAWTVFAALDAMAMGMLGMTVLAAWRGQAGGIYMVMTWAFAGMSAFGQYEFNTRDGAPGSGYWFFPAMALMGSFITHLLIVYLRKHVKTARKDYFGLLRWVPLVGSFSESYGALRVKVIMRLATLDDGAREYERLMPHGGLRVMKAIRADRIQRRTVPTSELLRANRRTEPHRPQAVRDEPPAPRTELGHRTAAARVEVDTVRAELPTRRTEPTPKPKTPASRPPVVSNWAAGGSGEPLAGDDVELLRQVHERFAEEAGIPSEYAVRKFLNAGLPKARRIYSQFVADRSELESTEK